MCEHRNGLFSSLRNLQVGNEPRKSQRDTQIICSSEEPFMEVNQGQSCAANTGFF